MNVTSEGKTREAVTAYQAFLSNNFAEASFQSCKNVRIPATGGFAIATMCGRYGAKLCTAQRWYDFQGDSSNGLAPLDIDFRLINEGDMEGVPVGVIPYNGRALKCNETTPSGGEVCSCLDCQESCPRVPPPPAPPSPFSLFGIDGFLVISIILLCLLVFAFLFYLTVSCMVRVKKRKDEEKGKRKKKGKDQNCNDVTQQVVHPSEVTWADKKSLAAQAHLSAGFQRWGTLMATYPLTVSIFEVPVPYGV